jgi:hypothetical protein
LAELDEQITTLMADYEPIIERLETIPRVARKCAVGMIAEIGVDMSVFATPAHLASWAGICPGNNASGGKARSGRTRHGPVALKTVLTEAAQAAGRTKNTYLGARYHAIRGRRGTFKAVGTIRHDILIAYRHIVGAEVQYEDLGADWITRRDSREYQIAAGQTDRETRRRRADHHARSLNRHIRSEVAGSPGRVTTYSHFSGSELGFLRGRSGREGAIARRGVRRRTAVRPAEHPHGPAAR